MPHFQGYDELKKYMEGLGLFSMDLGLGRMEGFWKAAGFEGLPPVIHVVGTNGKGSTSTFIESIARAHGLRTGLFTSPHFVTPRERIRVEGQMLSREQWTRLANLLLDTRGGGKLTYFEFQTCLAMLAFRELKVDVAIMEAGLGGRFDATNVFRPKATVLTPIGMDHEKVLGKSLAAIAGDKAGAMRSGGVAVSADQAPEALRVLVRHAEDIGARLMNATELAELPKCTLGLRGPHQQENARLAMAAWKLAAPLLDVEINPEAVEQGLGTAFIPGRLQLAELNGQTVILDGAHNAHALKALKASLDSEAIAPRAVVFGCMADKDMEAMLPLLESLTEGAIIVTQTDWDRAATPEALANQLHGRAEVAQNIGKALEKALRFGGPILVCGSLYLLGDVYSVYPELLNQPQTL